MTEKQLYDALDPLIKKKYEKRFVRSVCGIDDLLQKKRYIYDLKETEGAMLDLIDLLNELNDEKLNIAFEEEFDRDQCIKLLNQFKNHVFTVIDGKIKDVEKELEDYHLENENAMLVGRLWALKELKEELMENEEWLGIELE